MGDVPVAVRVPARKRVLNANRGKIAARAIRPCQAPGLALAPPIRRPIGRAFPRARQLG